MDAQGRGALWSGSARYLRTESTDDLVERVVAPVSILGDSWFGLVSEARIAPGDLDVPHLTKELRC